MRKSSVSGIALVHRRQVCAGAVLELLVPRWLCRRLLDVRVVASDLVPQSHHQIEVGVMSHPAILPVTITFVESSTHDYLLRMHEDRKDRVGAKDVLWNFATAGKRVCTGRCDDE